MKVLALPKFPLAPEQRRILHVVNKMEAPEAALIFNEDNNELEWVMSGEPLKVALNA